MRGWTWGIRQQESEPQPEDPQSPGLKLIRFRMLYAALKGPLFHAFPGLNFHDFSGLALHKLPAAFHG